MLHLVDAAMFPLIGASAGLLWLIAILMFHRIGMQVAQVQKEAQSAERAPDQDTR
jgi:hypothetical protein